MIYITKCKTTIGMYALCLVADTSDAHGKTNSGIKRVPDPGKSTPKGLRTMKAAGVPANKV